MPSKLVKFSCDLLSGTRVCFLEAFQEHWAKNHLPRPELSIESRNANIHHKISSASVDACRSRHLFLETPPRLTQNQVAASSGWFTKSRRKTCFIVWCTKFGGYCWTKWKTSASQLICIIWNKSRFVHISFNDKWSRILPVKCVLCYLWRCWKILTSHFRWLAV